MALSQNFADNVKKRLYAQRLNVAQLSGILQLDEVVMWEFLDNKKPADLETVERVAKVLGMSDATELLRTNVCKET